MLVVLPPSETKVSGGLTGHTLDVPTLSFPSQEPVRRSLVEQVVTLSGDLERALVALKLGPKGDGDIERNRTLLTSFTLPALARYSGVLYDALDQPHLGRASAWADDHVAIFSALFGLVRATDLIPAYRLSFDSALPAGSPVKQWASVSGALWDDVPGFVLDLRSEGYRTLAPVPLDRGVFVNLVQPGPRGSRKALGHTNKSVKGQLVRMMALDGANITSIADAVAWGSARGWDFDQESYAAGRIDLVVSGS